MTGGLVAVGCRVLRVVPRFPFRFVGIGVLVALLGWATNHASVLDPVTLVLQIAAWSLILTGLAWWAVRWVAPAVSTKAWVARRDHASDHAGGVATWLDIAERTGPSAMRTRARVLRPSVQLLPVWRRRQVPLRSFAVPLLTAGWMPVGSTVWSSCEEVTLRFGGPRSGKSASLACHALDAPGALLVTSTRTDLLENTGPVRQVKGRVDVFNPTGLGGLASTVRWSPLAGCADLGTAHRRAADLIPPSFGEGERWDAHARALLAVLMHAAALSGGTVARARFQTMLASSKASRSAGFMTLVSAAVRIFALKLRIGLPIVGR